MATERPKVEYYFSFTSLWSYMGSLVFQDIVKRHGVDVEFKPINMNSVFAAGGGKPVLERPPQRQSYRLVEFERWRRIRGIPVMSWPKFYPVDPSLGHRMLLAAFREGKDVTGFAHAGLKAVWADGLNVEDADTLVDLANANGLDGRSVLAQAKESELIALEASQTQEAIERQLFGAPFYFFRGEPFWGQDRLDQLEHAIVSGGAPILPTRVA